MLIARQDNRKFACPGCAGPILRGQKIAGEKGAWRHADCADLAVYPVPPAKGRSRKPLDPNAPMSADQLSLIGALFGERVVTQGFASVVIDYLKMLPYRPVSVEDQLADDLRSVA